MAVAVSDSVITLEEEVVVVPTEVAAVAVEVQDATTMNNVSSTLSQRSP